MLDKARAGQASMALTSSDEFINVVSRVEAECELLATDFSFALQITPWLPTSEAVNDMSTDFMAPLLRGLLDPGVERGENVSRFWDDQFGWDHVGEYSLHWRPLSSILTVPPGNKAIVPLAPNDAPVALFNACDAEAGTRLILGFPPLPTGLITDPAAIPSRNGPYSLTDRDDLYYRISLAEAVRLSANFPWGFEVGQLNLKNGADPVLALDGGIVNNSGIDSITHLIRGLTAQAEPCEADVNAQFKAALEQDRIKGRDDPKFETALEDWLQDAQDKGRVTNMQVRSYRVVRKLRHRGVLILHIDSGSKQVGRNREGLFAWLATMFPSAFRPFQALNNASYANADLATLDYDVVLDKLLRPEPTGEAPTPTTDSQLTLPPSPPIVQRVQLVCNNSENVMTAWSLGPADKAHVIVQFLIELVNQGKTIGTSLATVQETVQAYRADDVKKLQDLSERLAKSRKSQLIDTLARKQFYGQTAPTKADPTPPPAMPAAPVYYMPPPYIGTSEGPAKQVPSDSTNPSKIAPTYVPAPPAPPAPPSPP